jgi:putative lipoic acid-binding regulatory protein
MTTPNPANLPELAFPLTWHGRIIAYANVGSVSDEIVKVLTAFGKACNPTQGHTSRAGTYVTYRIEIEFEDRISMDEIIYALSRIQGVRTVI